MNNYEENQITYKDLETLCSMNEKACIFGAGVLGKIWAYALLKNFGFQIEYYFDNNLEPGICVQDGISAGNLDYLYSNCKKYNLFLAVSTKYQNQILFQLNEHGINNVFIIDHLTISNVMKSIEGECDVVKKRYKAIYSDVEYLGACFRKRIGYDLNINNPKTFNEKLQWLKLYNHIPLYTILVDKYEVKKYVEEKIGKEYIIPTLGIWNHYDDIDFEKLSNSFVLKCTHDSGSTVLIKDKGLMESNGLKNEFERKLKANYYWIGREWPYKNVIPRIIAEPFMTSPEDMIDYKFMCFEGKIKVIFTCTERLHSNGLKVTFFDLNWKQLNFERHYPSSKKKIERPKNLELMIKLAEILSEGIPFVRIDFYEVNGQVYFGEYTFFPGGGMEEFTPIEWDYRLGEWLHLPEKRRIE